MTENILGINFFRGSASQAAAASLTGGLVITTSAPALTKLRYDGAYRSALQKARLIIPDSQLLVLLWRLVSGNSMPKVSGIDYLRALLANESFRQAKKTWIVSNTKAKTSAIAFFEKNALLVNEADILIADDHHADSPNDHQLLLEIEPRKPEHILIALHSGRQEQLGAYLHDYLLGHPGIHCLGAALGFLTGEEGRIPEALQRHKLGWLARFIAQPRLILPRLGGAFTLALMVFRYRAELPPLSVRWADV